MTGWRGAAAGELGDWVGRLHCPVPGCAWDVPRHQPSLCPPPAGTYRDRGTYLQAMITEGLRVANREDDLLARAHLRGHTREEMGEELWELLQGSLHGGDQDRQNPEQQAQSDEVDPGGDTGRS